MDVLKRTWADISLDNARDNFRLIKEKVNGAKVCCVIKADGYGHGAVALAELYEKLGADFFAVSNIDEAHELRDNGIKTPILILGYTPAALAAELSTLDIRQAVFSAEYAEALNFECEKAGVKVKMHVKLDTGMSRIGFMCQEFPRDDNSLEEIKKVCSLKNLIPEGIFTHFCVSDSAEDGREFTQKQFDNFERVVNSLKENNVTFKYVHCSNSGAIEDYPETYCNMVRAGIILYGLAPSPALSDRMALKPCMTLKTVIAHVKTVEKGATISYGRTFEAEKKMKIATVPVGYADGFIRAYAKDGYMLVNGEKAPVVGRICMDQAMLDVTGIDVKPGDEVVVFGEGARSADELAESADTINYEVVCTVSKRVPRLYVHNEKITEVMYKI